MLFVASILLLVLQCVLGTPQLRLSHTGYEIISFNDQTPDDSLPAAGKLTLQNASRYNGIGVLNLEKAEAIDDETDSAIIPSQHKRHYDLQRSSGSKSELRRNTIDPSLKVSSASSEKTNVYLAVGIPTRFENPSSRQKETSNLFSTSEVTSSSAATKNSVDEPRREKMITSRIVDKKTRASTKFSKQSMKNQESSEKALFDSDFDSADAKEDSDVKSDSEEKIETKSAFPMVGKLPSIQIHRQRTFSIPSKSPAMFSPIYPSGFDVAGNFLKKTVLPMNEASPSHNRSPQFDSKNPKSRKYVDGEIESQKKFMGQEMNEIGGGAKKFADSYRKERVPSIVLLKNILKSMKHDIFNSARTVNGMPITGLHPVTGTSLYVSPFSLMLQQPLRALRPSETHVELNSMPLVTSHVEHHHPNSDLSFLHPQGRLEELMSASIIDAPKVHQIDNHLDSKYMDSKVNHRIVKPESKIDFLKNYLGRMNSFYPNFPPTVRNVVLNQPAKELLAPNVGSSKGNLVIDIVHELGSEDLEEDNKLDTTKDIHEMQDIPHAANSVASKNTCKRMKPITPPFYQFLAKFGDIIIDNALKYEKSVQVRDSALELIEASRKKNSEHSSGS